MADQQSTGLLGLPPTVWIALVLGLAGAFAITQKPFQDTRPTSPNVPLNHHRGDKQAVEARLWEDPLTAVALTRLQSDSVPAVEAFDLADSIQDHASHNRKTLVLGIMVSGAPYTEDIETRRRARYAVLAGLYRADFLPVNRDHVGYLFINPGSTNTKSVVVERPGAPRDASNPDTHDIAAFEWFQRDNSAIPAASGSESNGTGPEDLSRSDHVLLLWLDQEGFRELPIRALSNIFKSIAPKESPLIEFAVLGPADSDGLRAMHVEAQRASAGEHWPEDLRPMAFYSSRATASDASVLGLSPGTEKRLASELYESNDRIRFFRTVSDDQEVADAVTTELHEMRGIDRSEVALVAERDTLYARGMGSYFGGCEDPPRADPSTPPERPGVVMCFTYLRGLDGIVPNTAPASNAASQTSSGKPRGSGASGSASPASAASDAATGPGQLDYLRRLAGTIAALRQASPRIRAIGVISSDVYDKLLVLQALRSALPSATYFTFDLDARFVEQRNLKTTRQLIVGSSLGLALRPELQGDIPPFRDTYQSTTFFATMLAVHRFVDSERANADQRERAISQGKKPKLPPAPQCRTETDQGQAVTAPRHFDPAQPQQAGLQWTAHPRIFEIGRTREFDLSEPNSEACSFDCDCKAIAAVRTWWWGTSPLAPKGLLAGLNLSAGCLLALALALGRMAVIGQSKTLRIPGFGSRRWSNATAALVLVALLTAATTIVWPWLVEAITYSGKRVPTPLTGGANQWTASIIDLLSILTVILLVVRGQRKLHDSGEAIRREFGFEIEHQELIHWHRKQLGHNRLQAGLLSLLWFPIHPLPRRSGVELAKDTVSPLEAVMAQYLNHGTAIARFLRVICTAVVSVALLVALEAIPGIRVFRPSIDAISLASLFAMQFLILWTADALLLSRSFILTLWRDRPAWPAAALQKEHRALGLDQERATLWLNLRLIGRCTDGVAGLVWYPSFVIATSTIALLTIQFREFQFANNPIALVAGALFVIASAIALRTAAEAFRRGTRHRLEDDRLREQKTGGGSAAQLDSLLNRVDALRDGAFAPYSEQPIVRAVLVPAATYGATVVLQYLQTGG
jgi:hypothetical protein